MKKSQIITLVILFIAVSLFIWIGACSDDNNKTNDPSPTMKINTPAAETPSSDNTATATPDVTPTATPNNVVTKPTVDFSQLSGLSNSELEPYVTYEEGNPSSAAFSSAATKAALEQASYILSAPGTDTKNIHLSFMLHYSDVNSKVTKILDIAKNKNVKFTFYISSMYLNDSANEEIIKRMFNEGHTIGSRGDKSIDQLYVSAETLYNSLWEMETKYAQIVGEGNRMYFYAPDTISHRNVKLANLMGYTVTFKFSNFVTDSGTRSEAYNGVVFQSSNITDDLVTEVESFVNWGLSQNYTFKGFTK